MKQTWRDVVGGGNLSSKHRSRIVHGDSLELHVELEFFFSGNIQKYEIDSKSLFYTVKTKCKLRK